MSNRQNKEKVLAYIHFKYSTMNTLQTRYTLKNVLLAEHYQSAYDWSIVYTN